MLYNKKHAFTLLELSIVLLVIGLLIGAVAASNPIIEKSKLAKAIRLTQKSPVNEMDSVSLWLEATLPRSFKENEGEGADSDSGENTTISKWYDISPSLEERKNAVSAGSDPSYYKNCINDLPCVRFDGTNDYLNIENQNLLSNSDYTIFIVEQRRKNGDNPIFGMLSTPSANTTIELGYTEDNEIYLAQGGVTSNTYEFTPNPDIPRYSSTIPRLHSFVNSSLSIGTTTVNHYMNGSATASSSLQVGTAFDTISNITELSLGVSNNGTEVTQYNGDIGEIIFFRRGLSATQRRSVEEYLLRKWQIERRD